MTPTRTRTLVALTLTLTLTPYSHPSPKPGASLPVCMRSAFVASPGRVLLAADYKQLEIRLFAAFSGDPQLQREVREGGDLFVRLAALWYKTPCAQVTAEQRGGVKTMVYGLAEPQP